MIGPLLSDKNEYPDDEVLVKYLGRSKAAWDAFVDQVSSSFPVMSFEWRFYEDGKSWLCKLINSKKTMCWISVWDKYFKTTFYFMDRNAKDIRGLKIDEALKDNFRSSESSGKLKPITIEVRTKKCLSDVFELLRYKSGWKAIPE